MAKKHSGHVTLSMTLEEADLVLLMMCREKSDLEERISIGGEYPESDILAASAREAGKNLPTVKDLHHRVLCAYMDAMLSQSEGRLQ